MIDVLIEPTKNSPLVKIDAQNALIDIKGKSSPENAPAFYHPIIRNIRDTFQSSDKPLTIELAFRYFNTSSSKCLFDLFKTLKNMIDTGLEVVINWQYEEDDEDMLETGEDFSDLLGLDFNFIPVEDINDKMLRRAI